jgi:hypothetical protein
MREPKVGDVLCVTEWYIDLKNYFRKPRWCVVTSCSDGICVCVKWIIGGAPRVDSTMWRTDIVVPRTTSQRDCDKFEIVPESEWPDEVFVAFAKLALMGEDA